MRAFRLTAVFAAAVVPLAAVSTVDAGSLFVTGHDADSHGNSQYIRAGLDYLAYGHAASGAEVTARATKKVAYIGNYSYAGVVTSAGYTNTTFLNIGSGTWTSAFATGSGAANVYDILVIGSGLDAFDPSGVTELNAKASQFAAFFNNGGGLFVQTDEGSGQGFYGFIPSFGSTTNNTISHSGSFSTTAAGQAIGLTEAIVDADITHSYYTGVDTSKFTVFETFNGTGDAVALGIRQAAITGGEIVAVPTPAAAAGGLVLLGGLLARRRRGETA